jgi:ribose 5-phosphate isomerase B
MRIAVASDHAGLALKDALVKRMRDAGHEVADLGTTTVESVDYPDFAALVGHAVTNGTAERGVLVCGTGIGMAIAANRFPAVRAVVCDEIYPVRLARQHNDVNVLCLGARVTAEPHAAAILSEFLSTPYEAGRHTRRVDKLWSLGK